MNNNYKTQIPNLIKGKSLNETVIILYDFLRHHETYPILDLSHFYKEIDKLTELNTKRTRYIKKLDDLKPVIDSKYNFDSEYIFKKIIRDTLDKIIINHIIKTDTNPFILRNMLNEEYKADIPKTTLFDRISKFQQVGLINKYIVRIGIVGRGITYYTLGD